ncbi:Sucrose/H+ symporter, plant [Penicillium camemberti]|uniref:Sucrose/H+ symporter, plant n=1 Tax=Penicillium camemberti (strain FM 013) TaxID=1429867 RepID=A0A0G4PRM1_PENC3|nr:Sucrose/H+ symporter, plant [Penicillium camemberti]
MINEVSSTSLLDLAFRKTYTFAMLSGESSKYSATPHPGDTSSMVVEAEPDTPTPLSRTVAINASLTCITGIGNLLAGLLTVCIPVISRDLHIPPDLQLWPASAFTLACGCLLLPCGAVADVLGCRRSCLLGGLLQTASALGAGLAATSTQLILWRVIGGLAASFCLPGAIGAAGHVFPASSSPRRRSIAFAAMGGGQPVGFGLGLVLGGVFSDTVGWRWGFYATAILNAAVLALAVWALPPAIDGVLKKELFSRVVHEIDWVGALLISACLALLSYELAVATGSNANQSMREPMNITLLCVAVALLPAFALWMCRQSRLFRPTLGTLNASEQLAALYFEDVLGKSTLTASLYFLPAPICGLLMNISIGAFLPHLRPSIVVPAACLVSGIGPLLLATLCRLDGPDYWRGPFQAIALNPLGADLTYTIAILVMTAAFPARTQALAGGVFNMLSQIGKSVGIATSALIARQVTAQTGDSDAMESLLAEYKAGWWYSCALGLISVLVGFWGLRSVQKVEVKKRGTPEIARGPFVLA